jgi:hypothetical protein
VRTFLEGKTPFLVRPTGDQPFAMAGLWERWRGEEGESIEFCTIVVADAEAQGPYCGARRSVMAPISMKPRFEAECFCAIIVLPLSTSRVSEAAM